MEVERGGDVSGREKGEGLAGEEEKGEEKLVEGVERGGARGGGVISDKNDDLLKSFLRTGHAKQGMQGARACKESTTSRGRGGRWREREAWERERAGEWDAEE